LAGRASLAGLSRGRGDRRRGVLLAPREGPALGARRLGGCEALKLLVGVTVAFDVAVARAWCGVDAALAFLEPRRDGLAGIFKEDVVLVFACWEDGLRENRVSWASSSESCS